MNKKLITLISAMLMLTACSGAKQPNETAAPETGSVSIQETVSEPVSETESETETEKETEADEKNSSSSVYNGNYYTITVDPEKWTNANELRQAAGEIAEGLDNGVDLSAEEYAEMCDALFSYNSSADSGAAANFNIVTQDIGVDMDMDTGVFGPVMEQGFNGVEGYDFKGWEGTEINGSDCLITNIDVEQMGVKLKMQQYIFLKGGRQTVITLTAPEDCFDNILPDFLETINSIVLK